MKPQPFHASLTRIADLRERPWDLRELPRAEWRTGDYVLAEVTSPRSTRTVELPSGRMVPVVRGDRVIGALGHRHATLEMTGSWEAVGDDGRMEILTGGGLFGRLTSRSTTVAPPPELRYRGHVVRDGGKVAMDDFVAEPGDVPSFDTPTVLVIGTSMSAGKTSSAQTVIRRLVARDRRVVGAKLTGAGRLRDVLTLADAGADPVYDFVDAGLPSTICPVDHYRERLRVVLGMLAAAEADAAVIEIGASPLEPYNGATAVEALSEAVELTILCASDPYAVVGVMDAFELRPDLVAGIAANTRAGVELVDRLTGLPCLDLRDPATHPELDRLLDDANRLS